MQRDADAALRAERACPLPRAVDEDFALDGAGAGLDPFDEAVLELNAEQPRSLEHLHAEVARALRQALREVGRIRLAVGRKPERALQVFAAQQRPLVQRFARREQVDVDAEAARHRGLALEHDPALRRARDIDAAALLPAGGEAGLALEARIELRAVLAHARHRAVRAHLPDQAGRVPGGSATEAPLLEQHHIAPAELRQVVGDAHADDAAADDDDLGMGRRRIHILSATTPAATVAAPAMRRAMCPSFSSQAPISAAKITEVSRSAATAATGARAIAHSTTPYAPADSAPPATPRRQN